MRTSSPRTTSCAPPPAGIAAHLGFGSAEPERPVPLADARSCRRRGCEPPAALRPICATDDHDRALHTYGRSYRDVVRAFRGRLRRTRRTSSRARATSDELRAVLDWAVSAGAAVIPFGGGTSVVGGVGPVRDGDHAGVVSLDLEALDRVLEVDRDLAARRGSRRARPGRGWRRSSPSTA